MREEADDRMPDGEGPAPGLDEDSRHRLGIVVIGRNEGARLERCLRSVLRTSLPAVYVDSGSTDGSPTLAESMGIPTVTLSPTSPYTAARARNAGRQLLRSTLPEAEFVQFLDGDTELMDSWPQHAMRYLDEHPDVVAVAGRLREREPEATLYKKLCEMEWDRPPGEAESTGGLSMMRLRAFDEVGGFREEIIAGEEGDLCFRLREKGGRIQVLPDPMAVHDSDMFHFSQWWRRTMRFGHAAVLNWSVTGLHGGYPKRRAAVRAVFWGLALPATSLALASWGALRGSPWAFWAGAGLLLLGWSLLFGRVLVGRRAVGGRLHEAVLYSASIVVAKVPESFGVVRQVTRQLRGDGPRIIEYKQPG